MTRDYEQTIRELRDPQYVYHYSRDYLKNMMDDAADTIEELLPSAEVEPVKRGRWIVEHGVIYGHGENFHYGDLWHCSECGRRELDVEGWDYCPTCGAKMDGEEQDA